MTDPIFLDYFIANTTGNGFIMQTLLNACALLLGASLIRGVEVKNFFSAAIVAVILALLNATLGAFMDLLTAPLRWITLGLFAFIIDAIVILITARYMENFRVDGFKPAVFLAVALSIFNILLSMFI